MSQAVVGHVPRFFKLKLKKVMVTCRDVFRLLIVILWSSHLLQWWYFFKFNQTNVIIIGLHFIFTCRLLFSLVSLQCFQILSIFHHQHIKQKPSPNVLYKLVKNTVSTNNIFIQVSSIIVLLLLVFDCKICQFLTLQCLLCTNRS